MQVWVPFGLETDSIPHDVETGSSGWHRVGPFSFTELNPTSHIESEPSNLLFFLLYAKLDIITRFAVSHCSQWRMMPPSIARRYISMCASMHDSPNSMDELPQVYMAYDLGDALNSIDALVYVLTITPLLSIGKTCWSLSGRALPISWTFGQPRKFTRNQWRLGKMQLRCNIFQYPLNDCISIRIPEFSTQLPCTRPWH